MEHSGKKHFLRIFKNDYPDGLTWNERTAPAELAAMKRDIIASGKKLLDMAEDQKRALSSDEELAYLYLTAEIDAMNKVIEPHMDELLKRQAEHIEFIKTGQTTEVKTMDQNIGLITRAKDIRGYREQKDELSEADFFRCLATKDYGPLAPYRAENRTGALMGLGAAGGFAIPEMTKLAVLDGLLQDQGVFSRIGKEFVEATDRLNVATFENCDIDDNGLYGFSTPEFVSEGGTITAGTPRLNRKSWTLKKLVAETKISIELAAIGALGNTLQDALKGVLKYGLEKYIINGNGQKQPAGLVLQPCGLPVSRSSAGAVAYADIYNMVAQTRLNNNLWIISQTAIPQLAAMVDAGNHSVWMSAISGGAAQSMPTGLMGYPVLFNIGLSPALGSKGDVMFCSDLSFYKCVLFRDIYVQTSDAAYWSTGEIGLRVVVMLDMDALPSNRIDVGGETYGWHTVLAA